MKYDCGVGEGRHLRGEDEKTKKKNKHCAKRPKPGGPDSSGHPSEARGRFPKQTAVVSAGWLDDIVEQRRRERRKKTNTFCHDFPASAR